VWRTIDAAKCTKSCIQRDLYTLKFTAFSPTGIHVSSYLLSNSGIIRFRQYLNTLSRDGKLKYLYAAMSARR
jgi:hypothetical protein